MDMLAQAFDGGIDWNALLRSDTIPVVLCSFMCGALGVTTVIAMQWRRVRISEAEAALKLRMVERGFSTEEIERVVQATPNAAHRGRGRGANAARSRSSDFLVGDARG